MWSLAREGEHSLLSCQGTATLAARWEPTALSEPRGLVLPEDGDPSACMGRGPAVHAGKGVNGGGTAGGGGGHEPRLLPARRA